MAALVNTTPKRVDERPLVPKIVKVVPRLVEQRAAPAANACSDEAPTRDCSKNENPIGTAIPVRATPDERTILAFKVLNDVASPPI
jgi:hypothetical protein